MKEGPLYPNTKDIFPRLVKVRQCIQAVEIKNIRKTVLDELSRIGVAQMNLNGKTVGITAGSRGIVAIAEILKATADTVKTAGGQPVIIPAMGSHGGGTSAGMVEVLEGIGITETSVGAPIRPCETSEIVGETSQGIPAYCNSLAKRMDHLIIVNRIKKHTDFTGKIESGLFKMMTIGLGGPTGASSAHTHAMVRGYEPVMGDIARELLARLPILCGVGIIENWKGGAALIEAILPERLYDREADLLTRAKSFDVKLPFNQLNVLVVGELGKDVSGAGMDGNIVGRTRLIRQKDPEVPDIDRIVVLSLTPGTRGNALSIGLADVTTRRVYEAVDIGKTALNCVTSMAPEHAAIPCTMETDREAIKAGIWTAGLADAKQVRLAYIQNTKKLETLAVSENLIEELKDLPNLEIIGEPEPMQFDQAGNFTSFQYAVI